MLSWVRWMTLPKFDTARLRSEKSSIHSMRFTHPRRPRPRDADVDDDACRPPIKTSSDSMSLCATSFACSHATASTTTRRMRIRIVFAGSPSHASLAPTSSPVTSGMVERRRSAIQRTAGSGERYADAAVTRRARIPGESAQYWRLPPFSVTASVQ
jgi:hypothetical protein